MLLWYDMYCDHDDGGLCSRENLILFICTQRRRYCCPHQQRDGLVRDQRQTTRLAKDTRSKSSSASIIKMFEWIGCGSVSRKSDYATLGDESGTAKIEKI